ncbi:hypothetical protein BOSE62_130233 [Bosea sp. 62]|nr:hypothetical protein BOSE46_40319 [Bosea sp. 46]VXB34904.1 hypothetical protein BOSE62_130233 [Bosea sp. 62]VXC32688.1 hypothetical protein BOSE29B_30645 [Bosea sp. 29B]VXC79671.1 hypothetical protein BOSE125_50317 [Bosea sp. 125]
MPKGHRRLLLRSKRRWRRAFRRLQQSISTGRWVPSRRSRSCSRAVRECMPAKGRHASCELPLHRFRFNEVLHASLSVGSRTPDLQPAPVLRPEKNDDNDDCLRPRDARHEAVGASGLRDRQRSGGAGLFQARGACS